MKTRNYLIGILCLLVLLSGCNLRLLLGTGSRKEFDVGQFIGIEEDGSFAVPGTTIVVQGVEYEDEVPAGVIEGIVTVLAPDGATFFYHPLSGNVPLNEATSQAAIVYTVIEDMLIDPYTASTARAVSSLTGDLCLFLPNLPPIPMQTCHLTGRC